MLDDLNRVVEVDQPVPGVGQAALVWHYTLDMDGEITQQLDDTRGGKGSSDR